MRSSEDVPAAVGHALQVRFELFRIVSNCFEFQPLTEKLEALQGLAAALQQAQQAAAAARNKMERLEEQHARLAEDQAVRPPASFHPAVRGR